MHHRPSARPASPDQLPLANACSPFGGWSVSIRAAMPHARRVLCREVVSLQQPRTRFEWAHCGGFGRRRSDGLSNRGHEPRLVATFTASKPTAPFLQGLDGLRSFAGNRWRPLGVFVLLSDADRGRTSWFASRS